MAGRNCKDCGRPFVWRQTDDGRWKPANENGTWHKCRESAEVKAAKSDAWKRSQAFRGAMERDDPKELPF